MKAVVKEARISFLAQSANLDRYVWSQSVKQHNSWLGLLEIIAEAKPGYFDRACVIRSGLERTC